MFRIVPRAGNTQCLLYAKIKKKKCFIAALLSASEYVEKFRLWVVWFTSFKATEQNSLKYFTWNQNNYLTNKYLWKQRIFFKELISKESV